VTEAAPTHDAGDGDLDPDGESSGMSRSTRSAIEWVAVIVGALVVALVVKTFLIQAFYIPSESMVPTLQVRDRVLVNKLSYDFGDIGRGDIVVFDRPGGPGPDGIAELIKRVVALEGETVEGRDNQVFVDGEPIDESYLPEGTITSDFGPEVVPDGHVWVMGDNRSASDDSRRFKSIAEDDIVGRAFVTIWPLSEIGML
jgi:signal peptidase I